MTTENPPILHIEILHSDPEINEEVMRSFREEDFLLESSRKWALYKKRKMEIVSERNRHAVERNGLDLLIRKNGQPTRKLLELAARTK